MKQQFLLFPKSPGTGHQWRGAFMRCCLLLILASSVCTVNAKTVDAESARQIARSFLGKEVKVSDEAKSRAGASVASEAIHIFNAVDGKGFVVVAGEDVVNPVLAYSDNGVFDAKNAPESALWLISQYQKAVEKLSASGVKTPGIRMANKKLVTRSTGAPLLSTQWNQYAPYNNQCPLIGGSRALTGCVATAMAQVVNYEKKSNSVNAIGAYTTESGLDVEELPARDFNFGNLTEDDIASLMRYCGQAVGMNYGLDESGAYSGNIPSALHNYFGWEPEIKVLSRERYNDEHWNRMVSEEIAAGHPLIYSAVAEGGGGHSFVVDGISDDYYHVNWGWGGLSDGYYSFSPFSSENRSDYILMQEIVTTRDDDPSNEVITYGTTINGINYQLQDDLTAVVLPLKNGEKYRGELVIPSTVEFEGKTYTVNYFGQGAFVNCKHLTAISIPASITGQAWSIFEGCENLHKVNVEDLAAFIRLEVGGWWTGSPFFEYGADLYLNGEIVRHLVIPEGIEEVGYCKFANCTSIESVTMPSTMKVAGVYSFAHCPKLKTVDMLGSSLEIIDILAFVNDEALEEVRLPATLRTIGGDAFGEVNGPGCPNLRKVISMSSNPLIGDENGNAFSRSGDNKAFSQSVDKNAFSFRVLSEADLYVPDEAVEIYKKMEGWSEFIEIAPLSQEKPLPQTDTITVDKVIYEINLTEKYAKILKLDKDRGDSNMSISIPEYVEYKNVSYPVEVIGYEAFYAQSLRDLSIPSGVRRIGINSFLWVNVQNQLQLPDSLKYVPKYSFYTVSTPKLILGENVERIGENAFSAREDHIYYGIDVIPEIECRGVIPPVIDANSFDSEQFAKTTLSVPYGSGKVYAMADVWSNFDNIRNIGDKQEEIIVNDLSLSASIYGKSLLKKGLPLNIACKVSNRGTQSLNGFNLKWDIDGVSTGEEKYNVELPRKEVYEFNISIPLNAVKAGSHTINLTASISNGTVDDDTSDNAANLSFETFDNEYYRVSLIEQFTSEQCVFTPSANPTIFGAIENTGNSDFVAHVFNHCGFYDDFLTVNHDYEWFYNEWGWTYTPAVMLNRTDVENTGYTPVRSVNDNFEPNLARENGICDAMVSVFLEIDKNNACVKTVLTKNQNFDLTDGYNYITVFLIEDSIPAREQQGIGDEDKYYHRNVLRKVASSTWGDRIEWNGDECLYKFETELDPEWNKEKLSAVAFIHRYNWKSPVDCQVYTAGASYLPQYIEKPNETAPWVTVTPHDPIVIENITLNTDNLELGMAENFQLIGTITPDVEGYNGIVWTSSDENVATVDQTGLVTSVNEGECVIRATSEYDQGIYAECRVLVIQKSGIESIPADAENLTVYNLQGIVVMKDATKSDLERLPKDLYIVKTRTGKTYKFVR